MAGTIGGIYGKALYDAAVDIDMVDEIYEQSCFIKELTGEYPQLNMLMSSQGMSKTEKKKFVEETFAGKLHELVVNLFNIAIDKKREKYLIDMFDEYNKLFFNHKGIMNGYVTTAVAISNKQLKDLEENLSSKTGKRVMLKNKEDKSIIGGVIVDLQGTVIDGSMKSKIIAMQSQIEEYSSTKVGDSL